jgi:putative cell wall-binding protein
VSRVDAGEAVEEERAPTMSTFTSAPGRRSRVAAIPLSLLLAALMSPPVAMADAVPNFATLDGSSSVTVGTGDSITVTLNVTVSPGPPWHSTGWRIDTTPPGTVTCVDTPNHTPSGTFEETFSITAPLVAGTYSAYFVTYSDAACSSNPTTLTMTDAVVVDPGISQTITFDPLADKTYGDADFAVSATASSGLAVSFSSTTPSTCSVTGTTVHIEAAGSCTIQADQPGDDDYAPAPSVSQSFTIAKADATIDVDGFSGVYDGAAHGATGSATGVLAEDLSADLDLGASFTDVPGGSADWTFTDSTGNYNDASGSVAIDIAKADQVITFPALGGKTFGDPDFTVSATASSGLPVSFSSTSPAVCTVTGATVHLVAAGTCVVKADQAGGTNFDAAPSVSRFFTVAKASQTISFAALGGKTLGDPDFAVSATASSGLPVSFSSTSPAVCTVTGATVHLVAAGTCVIKADQAGNGNYLAAPSVSRFFTVAPAPVTGTVTRIFGADRYATAAMTSAATFDPGVPVVYIATGENYPDALAGGPAAAFEGGPVLLVRQNSIPAVVATELDRLDPVRIVVLGGPAVVSDAVKTALDAYTSGTVTRIFGADRYATAAMVSAATFDPGVAVVYVVTGENFPDALAAGPAAAFEDGPVLLVRQNSIPAIVATELDRLDPDRIVVLGGPAVVSDAVKTALDAYTSGTVTRIDGATRYATAAMTSAAAFDPGVPVVYITTGENFPDALAGGPAAALEGGVVLLVRHDSIPAVVATELDRLDPFRIVVLGGPAVVSDAVKTALEAYLAP